MERTKQLAVAGLVAAACLAAIGADDAQATTIYALDRATNNNLYRLDTSTGQYQQITLTNGTLLNTARGLTADAQGNLYAANSTSSGTGNNSIVKITLNGNTGVASAWATGLNQVYDLTTDSTYLYASNRGAGNIVRLRLSDAGGATTIGSASAVGGVTMSASGTLYFSGANGSSSYIYQVANAATVSSNSSAIWSSGLAGNDLLRGIDAAGTHVYALSYSARELRQDATLTTVTTFSGFQPLFLDSAEGSLFAADYGANSKRIQQLDPATGSTLASWQNSSITTGFAGLVVVPEPATVGLLSLVGMSLVSLRRRSR